MSLKSFLFEQKMKFWPPLLGAGIRITNVADDFTSFDAEMTLRPWNKNIHGMHFGGSLFSMTDPSYGIILSKNLGKDYIVLDKEASIKFLKPGKGKVTAHFNIARERINEIKKQADDNYKVEPRFKVEVRDEAGVLVAEVQKTVYIRRKDKKPIHGYKPTQV